MNQGLGWFVSHFTELTKCHFRAFDEAGRVSISWHPCVNLSKFLCERKEHVESGRPKLCHTFIKEKSCFMTPGDQISTSVYLSIIIIIIIIIIIPVMFLMPYPGKLPAIFDQQANSPVLWLWAIHQVLQLCDLAVPPKEIGTYLKEITNLYGKMVLRAVYTSDHISPTWKTTEIMVSDLAILPGMVKGIYRPWTMYMCGILWCRSGTTAYAERAETTVVKHFLMLELRPSGDTTREYVQCFLGHFATIKKKHNKPNEGSLIYTYVFTRIYTHT